MTAEECHNRAIRVGLLFKAYDDESYCIDNEDKIKLYSPWVFFLVRFLHDLGKHGSFRSANAYYPAKKKFTKGHGLIGCAMLTSWVFTREFKNQFLLKDSDCLAIATAVNYHMYGYPLDEHGCLDDFRLKLLGNALNNSTVHLLNVLRYGDIAGRIESKEQILKPLQDEYEKKLTEYSENPPNMFELMNNPALVICITGMSETGRTRLRKKLTEWMVKKFGLKNESDFFQIIRDDIIFETVKENFPDCQDEDVYRIYKCNNFSSKVNYKMSTIVGRCVNAGRVVIIDSLACLSVQCKKIILSAVPPNTIKIDLYAVKFPPAEQQVESRMERQRNEYKKEHEYYKDPNFETNHFDPIGATIPFYSLEPITETHLAIKSTTRRHQAHYAIPFTHGDCLMYKAFKRTLLLNLLTSRKTFIKNR